ncbi:ribosomal protein S18-alanine N-acetyltransferase [Leucobacter viscericola]|uniref:[Ribosomal protein bS18]-alanine N-acetyltransferase n=1 Tax=Leucobacter viscericola TaxID=2714935 RepID=A0A6G7XI14_9MICO|nr:ribosomal protein S18-alanine N-acetyltransferase [Leucobacter viscericola]QIK64254.1 ribosomal protein S18-alanine N-acetyltransferase [Leucobacter viscericola]
MSELTLRLATEADLDGIWAIESSVFAGEAWSRDMMREELTADHRHYIVLTDEAGAIKGYAGLMVIGTDGDIQTIATVPDMRGRGQGRRLMNALIDEAVERGVREIFLEVRADNPVARKLYSSLGFVDIGIRPAYYQPGSIDAVVMKLDTKDRA